MSNRTLTRIAIVGKGRLGGSLARALRQNPGGFELHSWVSARNGDRSKLGDHDGPDVLIIAAKDDAIASVAKQAAAEAGANLKLIVHLAGSKPSTILPKLPGVRRLTLHPIQTFPDRSTVGFKGITWMASSDDTAALRWARTFVKALGARGVIVLPAESLALYHAMIVFGSNFTTLIVAMVEELSASLKLDPAKMKRFMTPLIEASLKNALKLPAMEALTGPIKRKDLATLKSHRKALKATSAELREVYDAGVRYGRKRLKGQGG